MPNVVKVAMRFSIATHVEVDPVPAEITDVVVTWHAQAIDSHAPPDEDDLLALAGIAALWWTENGTYADKLRDYYLKSTVLEDVTALRVSPTIGDPLVLAVESEGVVAGAGIIAPLPPQCAYLIGLRTLEESRRGRGRMYLPPLGLSMFVPNHTGQLESEAQDRLATFGQELYRRVGLYEGETPTWALCVYSRVADESHAVTRFEIPDRVCTQRRRAYRPLVHTTYDGVPPEP